MRLRLIPVLVAAAALLAPAGASANTKLVLKLTAGHPSPVDFTSDTQVAVGKPRTLDRAERLRRLETIQIVWHTGDDAIPPTDCPCPGEAGLRPEKGTKLVNVVVQAMKRDQVVAVAPADEVFIEGRRPGNLKVTYDWAADETEFPPGTRVAVYGLFVRG
ncbi:MAG TPA: hypothetical protein VFR97_05905 [Capillimicrobium sp.]|nr:hypothetical protein [Capillimicrobium sp.]